MKTAIVDKNQKEFTDLRILFNRVNNFQREYNWLLSDMECYYNDKKNDAIFHSEYTFLTGDEITDIVNSDDIHWAFAVCSGFAKNISLKDILKHKLPYADGNPDFWKDDVNLQHPLATVELVPWDSTFFLFLSKNDELVDEFMKAYPLSYDLVTDNIYFHSVIFCILKI